MKSIILLCLALAVMCEELHFFHYKDGSFIINKDPAVKIDGPLYVNFRQTVNNTLVAGMHSKNNVNTPFGFTAKITKFEKDGDNFKLEGDCWEGAWGQSYMQKLTGKIYMTGNFKQEAIYNGSCTDEKTKNVYIIVAKGPYSPCRIIYTDVTAARRAYSLVGMKEEMYKAVHVLDYAFMGYPYLATVKDCKYYLDNFKEETTPKPGFAIVAKDAAHCAIVDFEGDKFIHSNPVKKEVTVHPLSMLKDYFKNGYLFKNVKC